MEFFDMNFIDILKEGLTGGLSSVFGIALIVVPLMIFLEIARDMNLLEVLSRWTRPLTKALGINESSALPLAIGLIFGLAYGAGVIIQSANEGEMDQKSLILVSMFLACCHAVIEDTLLFVPVGANGWMLLGIRLVVAFVITALISKYVNFDEMNAVKDGETECE